MENRTDVYFYKPRIEDLWFRQTMLADPDTMSYNRAWGGTVPFPREKWADWYDGWIAHPQRCFYRYIATGKSRSFVGEAAYHYDPHLDLYLADVIIAAKCRRQGFGKAALLMLCEAAKKENIPALYDNIAVDNPGTELFLQCGFQEDHRTDEFIFLKRML